MGGLINVFETMDTRMEIEVHWADEGGKDTLSIDLRHNEEEGSDGAAIYLELQDLAAVMIALEGRLKEMRTHAQLRQMARFRMTKEETSE